MTASSTESRRTPRGDIRQSIAQAQAAQPQTYAQTGFAWDAQDAYLFDIDGTLLRSRDRIHYDAFFAAVEQVIGRPLVLDGVVLHGNTDPGILRDAFALSALDEASWRPHLPAVFAHMASTASARQAEMDLVVMPGVEATLAHLKANGKVLGLATGNIESIGWIKVTVAGLRDRFTFGGFSDQFEDRADMIEHALALARIQARIQTQTQAQTPAVASVCVVGDTPSDILAARAHGLPTIAVATGNYTFAQLMEHKPEVCTTTLEALLQATKQATTQAEGR